jgi:RNA polymerase-binding transcription factor DksA
MARVPRPAVRLHAPKIKVPKVQAPKLGRSGDASRNGSSRRKSRPEEPVNRELIAERDRLLEKFTVMQADLGGAFYEMAIRDHVKLDVLTRKAAELQRVDVELGQIEEALDQPGSESTGQCASCGAPYEPGARFCSRCGTELEKD